MLLLQILDATKCRVYQAALKTIDTRTHIHTFVWKRHPSLLVPFFAPPRRLQNGRHHSSFLHVCHDDWSMEDSKSMRMSVPWVVKVWSCFIWRSNGDESDAMNKIHFGVPHFGISRATYEHTWTYKYEKSPSMMINDVKVWFEHMENWIKSKHVSTLL